MSTPPGRQEAANAVLAASAGELDGAVLAAAERDAVLPDWAGSGLRLNALAPGAIMTPLLQEQLSNPMEAKAVRSFPIPVGGFGDVRHMADWMRFMLSDSADFLCGSVPFVAGGSDAYFRADDWPKPVPPYRLLGFLRRFRSGPGAPSGKPDV